jgi:N-acetylglutamate synthase
MISIREMTLDDYDAVMALLATVEGVGMRDADGREGIACYLARNPGMSFVAVREGTRIVGCVFGGHDGRRGHLYHLAVAAGLRGQGIGGRLVNTAIEALARDGIAKSHVHVFASNTLAQDVWTRLGWGRRDDLLTFSHVARDNPNA